MDYLFNYIGRRVAWMFFLMIFAGVGSCFRTHETTTTTKSEANPWSKNYVASERHASTESSGSSSNSSSYNGMSEETRERIRDEEFRREMVHKMREDYESRNGPVDSRN